MSVAGYPKPVKWSPYHPEKYVGDVDNIWTRSSWELHYFRGLDANPQVLRWSSEEIVIPYYNPLDKKFHRYFPDIWVEVQQKDGTKKEFLVEIKPFCQTQPPVQQKRKTTKYIKECVTYGVNRTKWAAAEKYCKEKGWSFMIVTEKELGLIK